MKQRIQSGTLLILIGIGILLGLYLFYRLAALVLLMLIALVLTTGIDPMVDWLQSRTRRWFRLPRIAAILLVLAIGLLVFLGVITFLVATAVNEAIAFARYTWPELQHNLLKWMHSLHAHYSFIPDADTLYARARAQSGRIIEYLWSVTTTVFGFVGGLFSAITVLILTVFFTLFERGIVRTMIQFIPPRYQQRVQDIGHKAGLKMGGWLRGQLLLALIVALIIVGGMWVLRVPYASLIGIIGGIGELVPMVGPYIAFVLALIIILVTQASWWQIFAVVAFFLLLSQFENYILTPKIMQRALELPPLTTLLALLIGGSLLGIVGALLAVPFAAAGRVVMYEAIFPAIQHKTPGYLQEEVSDEE